MERERDGKEAPGRLHASSCTHQDHWLVASRIICDIAAINFIFMLRFLQASQSHPCGKSVCCSSAATQTSCT